MARTFAFSSARKRMCTLVRGPGPGGRLLAKGAPEALLAACAAYVAHDGSALPLDGALRGEVEQHVAAMAGEGLRTIALAYADVEDVAAAAAALGEPALEGLRLRLVAVIGIRDPPRKVCVCVCVCVCVWACVGVCGRAWVCVGVGVC